MVRAILTALVALGAGCGDDTTAPATADLSQPADLSTGGAHSCGVDGISLSCASVSGAISCFVCDYSVLTNGAGRCARPCLLSSPSCPTGQHCVEFGGDGGATPNFAVEGNGCAGYGFCR